MTQAAPIKSPASAPSGGGMEQARGKALKTFATNFILAFAAVWAYRAGEDLWQARKNKQS